MIKRQNIYKEIGNYIISSKNIEKLLIIFEELSGYEGYKYGKFEGKYISINQLTIGNILYYDNIINVQNKGDDIFDVEYIIVKDNNPEQLFNYLKI